jgi:hypothetical protein
MRVSPLLAVSLVHLAACSGHSSHGDDDPSVNCANEPTADELVVGLQKTGEAGVLDFQLLSATPAPPARGDNEWIVQITAIAGGPPVTGATIAATPFMPSHQHGTPIAVQVEPLPTDGQYKLAPINLWMPGLWETTIEVESPSGADLVVYRVCIPG